MRPHALAERLTAIDRRRRALLDQIETLDPALLTVRPQPEKWSIREIVEHLVLAERVVLLDLPDPSALRARTVRARHRLLYLLVLLILRFGIPVRAPSPGMLPSGERSMTALREMWDVNHEWLRAFVEGLQEHELRNAVFVHPVTGPLTAAQAVRMLDVHLYTHTRQIRRLQRVLL